MECKHKLISIGLYIVAYLKAADKSFSEIELHVNDDFTSEIHVAGTAVIGVYLHE